MNAFVPGQRWTSESEPELGLGRVMRSEGDRVEIEFRAAGETRTYVAAHAPLKRVRFRVGDKISTQTDRDVIIGRVLERDGLLVYFVGDERLPETQLSDHLSFRGPQERLFAGRFDPSPTFELRRRTLEALHRSRKSPVRGFVGGRIDLIPHQLYIAQEVANRYAPRVMLSDEVGLGKTIEACLIIHRLLLSGRAHRILLIVPESLVHQWFVEMLRRFSIWFHIFDEDRCSSIERGDPSANPFLDDQLVLVSLDFLTGNPRRSEQAMAAGWDILVVDEAHHLEWSPTAPSRQYQVIEHLSSKSKGLLLLTATPEQLGLESHFARLRLLDPDRYRDLAGYQADSKDYQRIARVAEALVSGKQPKEEQVALLRELLAHDPLLEKRLLALGRGDPDARQVLLEELLDLHGPGRVLFRNTRSAINGFPKRTARLTKLTAGPEAELWLDRLSNEFASDAGNIAVGESSDLSKDPRVLWLVALLRELEHDKVLLIVRNIAKAEALDAALRRHISIKTGLFHEGLTLVQRDRNAAWFAEPDGARLLICSEIGSEGRNFQFAHHLVLFDLPLNPELLEQRIGRLDRIGQTKEIEIQVPYVEHSPQEALVRWYHEGLNAFEMNLEGGNELLHQFGRAIYDLALEFPVADRMLAEKELFELVENTASARRHLRRILEQGRDRLLELNSFRPATAQRLIQWIDEQDRSCELDEYLLDVLEHFGVHIEEIAPRTWQLNPQGIVTDAFPSMPAEGMIATCDRRRALAREEVGFLTWDHPMVTGAMDLLLGSETGNCSFAVLPAINERVMLLEVIFILETIAGAHLHAERFLAPTPLRLMISHKLEDVSKAYRETHWERRLQKGSPYKLIENADIARTTLPAMLEKADVLAQTQATSLRQFALGQMNRQLGHEVERLQILRQVNDHVRTEEIELAQIHQRELATAINKSRLRLDCLRLIWKGPLEALS